MHDPAQPARSREQREHNVPTESRLRGFDFRESLSTDTLYSTHARLPITWLTTLLKFSSGQITAGQFSTLPHQAWLLEPHQLHKDAQFSKSNLFKSSSMKWGKLKRPSNKWMSWPGVCLWKYLCHVYPTLAQLMFSERVFFCVCARCSVKVALYNIFYVFSLFI